MLYISRGFSILETVTPFGEVPCIEIVVGGVSCVNGRNKRPRGAKKILGAVKNISGS